MHPLITQERVRGERCRRFCARCGQSMFEYFRSPDGRFGLVNPVADAGAEQSSEVRCRTCGARYRVLERLSSLGEPVERK